MARTGPRMGSVRVSRPRAKASRARTPGAPRPALAAVRGARVPNGAGAGTARATSPLIPSPGRATNRPKTGSPSRSTRLGKPHADAPSRI